MRPSFIRNTRPSEDIAAVWPKASDALFSQCTISHSVLTFFRPLFSVSTCMLSEVPM